MVSYVHTPSGGSGERKPPQALKPNYKVSDPSSQRESNGAFFAPSRNA